MTAARMTEVEKRVMESEQRTGVLLGEMSQRQARTEEQLQEIMAAISALTLQNNKLKFKEDGSEGIVVGASSGGQHGEWGRSTRYEFPKFDGDGFEGWIMRSEFFFEVAEVSDKERVRVAALHLEGKALQWHKGFASLHGETAYADWSKYTAALAARFGANAYEDPLSDLRNLRQRGSLQTYMDKFDELYPRTGIREDQALSLFLSGLLDELQMPVRMFKPKSLAEAYALAKLKELTVRAIVGKPRSSPGGGASVGNHYSGTKSLAVTATNYKPSGNSVNQKDFNRSNGVRPSQKLTSKEMDEKRATGECFWCTEKFSPGHICSKRRAYVMHLLNEEGETNEEDQEKGNGEESENVSELHLSIHALWGTEGPRIMRIRGTYHKRPIKMLIYTSSTHNFLNSHLTDKLGDKLLQVPPKIVEVANGQVLQCTQNCESFCWEMQGNSFTAEVFLLELESYDLILGGEWLSQLGEIRLDFAKLSMIFELGGEEIRLQGEKWTAKGGQLHSLQLLNHHELEENEVKLSHVMMAVEGVPWSCCGISQGETWPALELLLEEYEDIFVEPRGLPPK